MPRVPNPYRPGFNQAPAALAGREVAVSAVRSALEVAALDGRTPRPLIFVGGRGVGKTVLLGEAAAIAAQEHSWLTVPAEVRPGRPFAPQLIERLAAARDLYRQVAPGQHLQVTAAKVRASVLGVGGEIEVSRPTGGPAAPAIPLEAALAEACTAAAERGAGILLTLDEVQSAQRSELADLAATLQLHVPDNWPLVIAMAGLPGVRDSQRRVTYLERAEWHVLGLLDGQATERALREPARAAGPPMTASARAALAAASGGYPFAVQVLGHHAWQQSSGEAEIDLRHVPAAIEAADRELRAGLYESRWYDASPGERRYLRALADLRVRELATDSAAVARVLGKRAGDVSYLRERLMRKGTIFAEPEGLRFAVPGMAAWIQQTHGPVGADGPSDGAADDA